MNGENRNARCSPVPFHTLAQKHLTQRLIVKLPVPGGVYILPEVKRLLAVHVAAVIVVTVVPKDLCACTHEF
jgi:phosphoribosylformimino-5-aminoimidazole carboxamide ribonucleotide (ProFAR) isomerase